MAQGPHIDQPQGPILTDAAAVGLSVLWVAGVALAFWLWPSQAGGLRHVVMLLVMAVPVGMGWFALVNARAVRRMAAETRRLQAALAMLQKAIIDAQPPPAAPPPVTEPKPDPATSRFASRREVSRLIVPRAAPQRQPDQPALALGPGPEDDDPPLERPDLVRALNFPENQDDTEGFAALRRALRDRGARRLVQASQDVLTLLSQDGIYMDDLRPDPASADLWRRFAKGERGHSMDGLGAVRDHAALSLVAARMREDTIFRDAVHHFMRRFDEILVTFEEHATDTDLLELAETRTARAFMLLGRASRTFD
ncbi:MULTISPECIES: hypothetical protein [unclassified Yoonia]|uniref:hypothetical protein n=1 Tax=unclassified Yoonia TaxID=2629118 RepID=UPI002AFDD33A|nr:MULTISPECIES: hypothetical protein [unclassified Yoonia]